MQVNNVNQVNNNDTYNQPIQNAADAAVMLLPKLDRLANDFINWIEKHIPGTPSDPKPVKPIPGTLDPKTQLLPKLDRDLSDLINWIEKHIPGTASDPKKVKPIPGGALDPIKPSPALGPQTQVLPKLDREVSNFINWLEKHI